MLLAANRQLLLQSGFSSDHLAQPVSCLTLSRRYSMTTALTTCAASSAEDAVKETEMRYERVWFVTTTLLRSLATARSNDE